MVLSTDGQKYLDTARETLDGLASRFGSQERAPLLAQLEINRRLREAQLTGDLSEAHGDDALLLAYWEQFGHKGSVLDDLGRYVDGQSQLVGVMKEAIEGDAVSPESVKAAMLNRPQTDYKEYIRQLNAYKLLQAVTPAATDVDELRKVAKEQFRLYLSGAWFGESVEPLDSDSLTRV
jgi:hypothetical protein